MITIFNTILKEPDFFFVKGVCDQIYKSGDYIENGMWGENIKGNSNPVYIHPITCKNIQGMVKRNLEEYDVEPLNKNVIKGMMFYYWKEGSYIPWHTDENHSAGLTIYLNDTWNYQNGGLFLYNHNDQIKTLIPSRNTGVLQVGGMDHSTTIVRKGSKVRKTLQIFFDTYNTGDKSVI